ncbi:MAG: hypothetical protein KR126chlam5_00485 [Candidatus Anoxychlamydiales bacterium]|nr:hypothetical protein [Candidatus Anoxychlamydiales bacterium]
MYLFHSLSSLYRLIKPFECCFNIIFQKRPNIHEEKPSLMDSIYNVSTKIYEYFPSPDSLKKPCKIFMDKKKNVFKNSICKTAQSIKKVALFIFKLSVNILKKIDAFSADLEPIKIVEIKRHLLSITPIKDESKYFEIKKKYENYIKNTPYPTLNSKNIYFDDTLKQVLLTISLGDFEEIKDIDPTSKKLIIQIDWGMEIEYRFFDEIVETKNI